MTATTAASAISNGGADVPGDPGLLPKRQAVWVFLSFAFAYFFSALVRAVTATLAPQFSAELSLTAGDLGLLAGAYFFGFAATQLPLGSALDRHGPRRVLLVFLGVAVFGCVAFAMAQSFLWLTLARALIGAGLSACLMAPMTLFRRRFHPVAQLRANSWMLMTGSLGMVASTLPVQWLLPSLGWRGLFMAIAAMVGCSMLTIAWLVPRDRSTSPGPAVDASTYAAVFRDRTFLRFVPMGIFQYGGLLAVQSLWAGPWLSRVCGWTAVESAQGLFSINVAMLLAFMTWGVVLPRLYARGWTAQRLVTLGVPVSIGALVLGIALGPQATAWNWAFFCVASTSVSLSQPAIGQAFPAALAGRALSAYNLAIFSGVFLLQWGIGLAIDGLQAAGWSEVSAFRGAFALLAGCCSLSYVWFLCREDAPMPSSPKNPR
jgi:predicted MFS family arabinose efflux permease